MNRIKSNWYIKNIIIIFALLFLSSCAVTQFKIGDQVKESEGLIVFKFDTEHIGYKESWADGLYLVVENTSTGRRTVFKHDGFVPFQIYKLPVGKYLWKWLATNEQQLAFEDNWEFEVNKQSVTYIGNIVLGSQMRTRPAFSFLLIHNNFEMMKKAIHNEHPELLEKFKIQNDSYKVLSKRLFKFKMAFTRSDVKADENGYLMYGKFYQSLFD